MLYSILTLQNGLFIFVVANGIFATAAYTFPSSGGRFGRVHTRITSPKRSCPSSTLSSLKNNEFELTSNGMESSNGILDNLKAHPKEFLIGGLGIGLAGLELALNQPTSNSFFAPIVEACSSSSPDIHPYIAELGGPLVCAVTQLMYSLTQHQPAGYLAWMTTILGSMPALFLMGVEGGRKGVKPILNFPFVFMLLSQLVGVSVVMTGIWLPIYLWGRSTEEEEGDAAAPVGVGRLLTQVLLVQIPTFILSLLCFQLDPNQSPLWTLVAGILAGPIMAFLGIPQSFFPPTPEVSSDVQKENSLNAESTTLIGLALLAFVTWLAVVSVGWGAYGTDLSQLLDVMWFQAAPAVRFLTADAVFVYAGVLLAIAASSIPLAGCCLIATPLLGPGAASLITMAVYRQQQQAKQNALIL